MRIDLIYEGGYELNTILFISVICVVGFFILREISKKNVNAIKTQKNNARSQIKKERLTDLQHLILTSANITNPIYGENPSFTHAQMPNGARCFNINSIETLVKRELLKSDGKGGFLLTQKGSGALNN